MGGGIGRAMSHTYCDGADAEGEHVGEGGHGDGDAGVPHGQPHLLGVRLELLLVAQVVVALYDDKHVVDADSYNENNSINFSLVTDEIRVKLS